MNRSSLGILIATALATAACTTVHDDIHAYKSNVPDLSDSDVVAFAIARDKVVNTLKILSGTNPQRDGDDWRPVVDAGILYADVRCDRYMNALFRFDRARQSTSRQIGFTGSAASAAMALLDAGKDLIGLTPLGFTLADETVNNIGKGLLFDLSPSIVRSLVEKQQTAYVQGLNGTKFTTKTGAMNAIQAYMSICLPPSIEMEVSRAVEHSEYRPIDYFGKNAPPRAPAEDEKQSADPEPSPPPPAPAQPAPKPDSTPIIARTPED